MPDDDLILQLLKESRDAVRDLTTAVNELKVEIVGREKCDVYRKDLECRLDGVDMRLKKLEEERRVIGLTWDTVRNNSVLKAGFLVMAVNAILPFTGRIGDVSEKYGTREAIVVAAIFVIAITIVWIWMNRTATKKLLNL